MSQTCNKNFTQIIPFNAHPNLTKPTILLFSHFPNEEIDDFLKVTKRKFGWLAALLLIIPFKCLKIDISHRRKKGGI